MTHSIFGWNLGQLVLAQEGTAQAGSAPTVNPVGAPGAASTSSASAPSSSSTTGQSSNTSGSGSPPPGAMTLPLTLGAVLIFFMVWSVLQSKKEQKRRATLLNSINKLDKVIVAGGIIGKVIELTDTEVVLQLEDGKMRVARAAIQSVMSSGSKAASVAETKPDGVAAGV